MVACLINAVTGVVWRRRQLTKWGVRGAGAGAVAVAVAKNIVYLGRVSWCRKTIN